MFSRSIRRSRRRLRQASGLTAFNGEQSTELILDPRLFYGRTLPLTMATEVMTTNVRLVSSRETPGVDVSTHTPSGYRAITVSAEEMTRLFCPRIREQLYDAARSMRPRPDLKRVK